MIIVVFLRIFRPFFERLRNPSNSNLFDVKQVDDRLGNISASVRLQTDQLFGFVAEYKSAFFGLIFWKKLDENAALLESFGDLVKLIGQKAFVEANVDR